MPIVDTDIKQFMCPAGNSNPNNCLGGTISDTEITDDLDNNLFDDVAGIEAQAGDAEYRGRYFKNNHATLELQNTRVYIATQTTSPDDSISIGLDPAGSGDGSTTGIMTTIADESTPPAGVTFSEPATYGAGLPVSGVTAQKVFGLWDRRTVTPGAAAIDANEYQVVVQGETGE